MKANLPGYFEETLTTTHQDQEYKDTGCKEAKVLGYYGKCIDCPLDPCLEDGPRGAYRARLKIRNAEIYRRWLAGESPREIAAALGLDSTTIYRALESHNTYLPNHPIATRKGRRRYSESTPSMVAFSK